MMGKVSISGCRSIRSRAFHTPSTPKIKSICGEGHCILESVGSYCRSESCSKCKTFVMLNFISWLVDAKTRAQRACIFAKPPVVLQQASKCRQIHAFKTLNPSSIEYSYYQADEEGTSQLTGKQCTMETWFYYWVRATPYCWWDIFGSRARKRLAL